MNAQSPWHELLFIMILTTVCAACLGALEWAFPERSRAPEQTATEALKLLPDLADPSPATKDNRILQFSRLFVDRSPPTASATVFTARARPALALGIGTATGMNGIVRVLVAFDTRRRELLGISVLEQAETPGLGDRVCEPAFRNQFTNRLAQVPLRLGRKHGLPDEINGITGATISCRAVVDAANHAIAAIDRALAGARAAHPRGGPTAP